ncbi:MAG: hypothetical protein IJ306_02935 [Oscillospiraceae bacterium]|nr:hypothetical protein [Oscillospiraceae bacterium]
MIAYVALPEGESEWSTNWENRYSLEKGEYRIVKDGWFENEDGQQTGTHRMTAEFIIE